VINAMREAVAQFIQVTKRYPGGLLRRSVVAVDDVSLRVASGEIVGIVGPNRAGKSTLLKLLLTICRPTAGQITRFGRPWNDRGTLARVGYIHESQAMPGYLSARRLLEYYGALSGLTAKAVRGRVGKLLDQVELGDRDREPIARYSKGMLQRLALAQSLLNEPELLVFDEPTEGMDLLARRMVFEALAKQRRRGSSALLVSHALGDVESICDRVVVMRRGRLVFVGSPGELAARDGASFERALEPLYLGEEELVCV
jgi:ABC-2 type transport system ATP-binding protein